MYRNDENNDVQSIIKSPERILPRKRLNFAYIRMLYSAPIYWDQVAKQIRALSYIRYMYHWMGIH